jgi:hypothetical protein
MRRIRKKIQGWLDSPGLLRKFSGWEAIFWLIASIPIIIWFKDSVPLLVFISVYAIVRTALSNWQSSRMEERQQQVEDEQAEVLEEQTEKIVDQVDKVTPDA